MSLTAMLFKGQPYSGTAHGHREKISLKNPPNEHRRWQLHVGSFGHPREKAAPSRPSYARDLNMLSKPLGQHFPKQLIKRIQLMEKQS